MVKSGKSNFYAVAIGRTPGIYNTWWVHPFPPIHSYLPHIPRKPLLNRDDCRAQIIGFPRNKYQKFPTHDEARKYLAEYGVFIGSSNVSSASSSTPSSSRSLQHGPATHGRVHPYAHVKPPSTPTASVREPFHSDPRWAAIAAEVIQDESRWDVVYSYGAYKYAARPVAGIGVWWGNNDARYAFLVSIAFTISSDQRMHG